MHHASYTVSQVWAVKEEALQFSAVTVLVYHACLPWLSMGLQLRQASLAWCRVSQWVTWSMALSTAASPWHLLMHGPQPSPAPQPPPPLIHPPAQVSCEAAGCPQQKLT